MRPSGVHSPNDTSATSFGSTQWPRTSRGFSKNGVFSAGIAASACFTAASVFWSKPLPTPPAKRRCPASSWMPSRSEPMPVREPCGSVQPPTTNSWRCVHLSLIQVGLRRDT